MVLRCFSNLNFVCFWVFGCMSLYLWVCVKDYHYVCTCVIEYVRVFMRDYGLYVCACVQSILVVVCLSITACVCVYWCAFVRFCVCISNSISFSSAEMAVFAYITSLVDGNSIIHSACLPQNTVKCLVGKMLWTHKAMTKTTVADDEIRTASSTPAQTLNAKPITSNVVGVIFTWALKRQGEDKWHSWSRPKLLGSMSFPMLLGLNVALFRERRERGEWKQQFMDGVESDGKEEEEKKAWWLSRGKTNFLL